jgi:hypothetical protein
MKKECNAGKMLRILSSLFDFLKLKTAERAEAAQC